VACVACVAWISVAPSGDRNFRREASLDKWNDSFNQHRYVEFQTEHLRCYASDDTIPGWLRALVKEAKMKRIHEFEAWSTPGKLLPVDFGKYLAHHYKSNGTLAKLGIPDDVFLGLSNIPSEVDVHNLKISIEKGELRMDGFIAFCNEHGFEPDIESKVSACKYIEYSDGVPIAWIHIPEGQEEEMLPAITKLMRMEGLIVKEC